MDINRRKKNLKFSINNLSQTEHEEVFKIFKLHDCFFTQNKNGIFIDISLISLELLEKLELFVNFCATNKTNLDRYEQQINECRNINAIECKNVHVSSISINKALDNVVVEDDWQGLMNEVKQNEKICSFVSQLESNSEKLVLKRANTKFINAKKKYSKKIVYDKKNENDLQNNLTYEEYIV
jgi:hypothetical protein